MAKTTVAVKFTGDTTQLKSSLNDIDGNLNQAGGKLDSFGKKAGVAFLAVGSAAVLGAGQAINAASDLNEVLSKSNTVFGSSAKSIEQWASGASDSFGQSKREALEAASSFGNMFTQLGIGQDEAAGMSKKMTELASDFASFHNADITDVLDAQQAAFRGEYDAVQKFVPTINAAAVEQKALAMGLGNTSKELDAQDKALATQTLLLEGAGAAMGDFDRTSGSLANQQRTLGAQFEDIKAKVGEALIPVMQRLTEVVSGIVNYLSEHQGVLIALAAVVGTALVVAFTAWAVSAAAAAAATIAAAAPVLAVVAVIGALVAAAILAYKHIDEFRVVVDTAFNAIKSVVQAVWPFIQQIITGAMDVIRGVISTVLAVIRGDWSGAWDGIKQVLSGVWQAIKGVVGLAIEAVRLQLQTTLAIISSLWRGAWDGVKSVLSGAWDGIKSVVSTGVNWIVDLIRGLPSRVTSAASGMWNGLKSGLQSVVNGIVRGLEWMVNRVVDAINAAIDAADVIAGPLVNFGEVGPVSLPRVTLHSGGVVPGSGRQEVDTTLQAGEMVLTRRQQRALLDGTGGRSGPMVNIENLHVGSMREAVDELDWYARSKLAFTT